MLKPKSQPSKQEPKPVPTPQLESGDELVTHKEKHTHSRIQDAIIRLGMMTGCKVWVASNDKNKQYNGKSLGDGCLPKLPSLGLSDEATKRISLIDVIWIRSNAPVCAFEIEVTTSVYSGLLRMSDLLAVTPALNIKLFVVAPEVRQGKVMDELSRPTFHKTALSDYCRFVPSEELEALVAKVDGLMGITPDIIDNVAVGLADVDGSTLK